MMTTRPRSNVRLDEFEKSLSDDAKTTQQEARDSTKMLAWLVLYVLMAVLSTSLFVYSCVRG